MYGLITYCLLNADISKALSEISIESIIRFYGLLCLATLPVSLMALIFIYKKRPNIVSGFDKAVDKLVDGKKSSDKPAEEQKKDIEQPVARNLTIEEENEEAGCANMNLQVGDKYKCYLSLVNVNNVRGGDHTWRTDNPFVGKIDERTGVFEACKVGSTYINCGGEKIDIYYAVVNPNDTTWFGYYPINDVLTKTCIANVKVRELSKKILDIREDRHLLKYNWDPGILTYQTNKKDEIIRIMFRLPEKAELVTTICEKMSEYMDLLDTENKEADGHFWIHICGKNEDFPESVDYTAFLRKSKKGDYYFGIGECWRMGATETEIMNNTEMIVRSFKDLMDSQDVPTTVGKKLENITSIADKENPEIPVESEEKYISNSDERQSQQQKQETDGTVEDDSQTETNQDEGDIESPFSKLDDLSDIPETDSDIESEDNERDIEQDDYSEGENIRVESMESDPFGDFYENGEREYNAENPDNNDIYKNEE